MSVWLGVLLNLIDPRAVWRFAKRIGTWLKPQGLTKADKPLNVQIGESTYIGSPPYTDEQKVKDVVCQVILGNPSDRAKTVTGFRLEVKTKAPYLQSEARDSEKGGSFLVPSGGGFSTVPRKPWLDVPVRISSGDGVSGWIGFCLIQRNDLTFAEAWNMGAELITVQSDGVELHAQFPPCDLPRANSSWKWNTKTHLSITLHAIKFSSPRLHKSQDCATVVWLRHPERCLAQSPGYQQQWCDVLSNSCLQCWPT